jgi:predicted amidohydrolase YtcJ
MLTLGRSACTAVLASLAAIPAGVLGAQRSAAPDLIVTDAKVFTADTARRWAEGFAVRGDRIVAVGTTGEMLAMAGPGTTRIDARGLVIIPGINDAHVHLGEGTLGRTFATSDNTPAGPTLAEVQDSLRVIVARTKRGEWIQGPLGLRMLMDTTARRAALDAVAPQHPVILRTPWGHGMLVNSAALRLFGIADTAPDPSGGSYERDGAGRLTGSLVEYAGWAPVQGAQRKVGTAQALRQLNDEVRSRLGFGVTSVQDMASTWDAATTVRLLRDADLPVRVRVVRWPMPGRSGRALREWTALPRQPTPMIRVSGVKYVLEGTPQEQGALNRAPYPGRAGWHGALNFPMDTVREMLREALRGAGDDDQLMLHVVGDSSVVLVLDAMASLAPDSVWRAKRLRLEHASRLQGPLIARARRMGVLIAQPRASASYRSWLDAGITVGYGSDGQPNPFVDFAGAVTMPARPAEAITREEAATILTRGSAVVESMERDKGSITPGMLADFAILSQDIFTAPAGLLPATRSVLTVVGGRVVHSTGVVLPPR